MTSLDLTGAIMKRSILLAALILGTAAPAFAADIPVKARPAPVAVAAWDWNGFYLGLNGGYSWGRSRTTVDYFNVPAGTPIVPPAGSITSGNFDLDGGIFGGQVGYNWAGNGWLWGFETDLQWSGEKGTGLFTCAPGAFLGGVCVPGVTAGVPAGFPGTTLTLEQHIQWFGTLRARAGWLVTPSILLYATGGLAYGSIKSSGTLSSVNAFGAPIAAAFSNTKTNAGWTIGGGIEGHLGGNWTGKLEYLYLDLGTVTNQVTLLTIPPAFGIGANVSSRITDHVIRAGINYHFPPGPVVARY
jgi:outer membrane immunogenic protein